MKLFFITTVFLFTMFSSCYCQENENVALINIVASLALAIVCGVGVGIVQYLNHSDFEYKGELLSFVGFGLAMLVISLFREYGAEVGGNTPKANN